MTAMPGFVLSVVLCALLVLMSVDGMRFVFRGTRDHLIETLGCAKNPARFAASLAAISALGSGAAALITLLAWLGGVSLMGPSHR